MLTLDEVHAGYGDLVILRGVSLNVSGGTMTSVIGANGAGKSTLLKTIFGTVKTNAGSILFDGADITKTRSVDRLRRGIVLVPQGRNNFPALSVTENLEMGAFTRRDRNVAADVAAAYDRFPILGERRSQLAGNLSGGEQQLLEMAMAFMLKPRLALIDEPSLGLSPKMQEMVFEAIRDLRDEGVGIVMVEQNAVQALRISDRAVVLELGRVGISGSGITMLDDPHVRQAYLGIRADADICSSVEDTK